MDTGKAIFFGLALIALAIFAKDVVKPAGANNHQVGRYAVAGVPERVNWVWIMDTVTGRFVRCEKGDACIP